MKRIYYLFAIVLGATFVGCNPLEDINSEVDAIETPIVGDVALILSDDDYEDLDLPYGNFGSVEEAKDMLPDFLSDKYLALGDGSSALVTAKFYNKVATYSKNIYELTDAEHNDITGGSYGNFDKSYHIYNYLEATFPDAEEGDFESLRYRFYSGGESTLTDGFFFSEGDWEKIPGFTEDEYKEMGNSYPNFSGHDEAEAKMPIKLLDVYKYDALEAGSIVSAMYELYKGGGVTKSYTKNFLFDGASFSVYNNVINETIQFGHDGLTWVPDNTIKYILESGDYTLIVEALGSKYPDPTDSMGNYGNFERRPGNKNEWTFPMIAEAMDVVLTKLNPSAAEGQKYVVTYDIYNGSNGTENIAVIKNGEGVWVEQ